MAAPFSEPREWQDCAYCRAGSWDRYFRGDDPETAFAPCPECSQPPRCGIGSAIEGRHCPRPGTVQMFKDSGHTICGQHYRAQHAHAELGEWTEARKFVGLLAKQAEVIGLNALCDVMDLAWAECEMRIEGAKRELRLIWGYDE